MPMRYWRNGGITTVEAEGSIEMADIRATFVEIRDGIPADAPARILIRDLGSDFFPDTAEIRELLSVWGAIFEDMDLRVAVLTERDLQYGIGRQTEVHADLAGFAMRAFRMSDEEVAVGWLEGE